MASGRAVFYHNLSLLLDAGVPLLRSLDIVREGLKGPMKRAFVRLSSEVAKGNGLAETMAQNRWQFLRVSLSV